MKPMTHEEAEVLIAKYAHAPFALIRAVEDHHGVSIIKPPINFTHDENGSERN